MSPKNTALYIVEQTGYCCCLDVWLVSQWAFLCCTLSPFIFSWHCFLDLVVAYLTRQLDPGERCSLLLSSAATGTLHRSKCSCPHVCLWPAGALIIGSLLLRQDDKEVTQMSSTVCAKLCVQVCGFWIT